jgi:Leucine-rich repeat (LRR) protein
MSSAEEAQENENIEEEEAGKYNKNESFAEEAIPKQPLSKDIIAECISMPYRLGYGFSHAFVKLDCSDRNLSDISILREYIHLRFIILSNNFVTDICPCSVIGHLIYLKADNNQIADAACLTALRFLQFLDLSGNKLTTIRNLAFPLLQHLKVNDNMITSLEDASGNPFDATQLPALHTLELRGNKLTTLKGIGSLPNLKSLYAAENSLRSTDGIEGLTSLIRLHLRDNQIRALTGFTEDHASLEYVNIRGNQVSKFGAVKHMDCLPSLKIVSFVDNPIAEKDDYRLLTIGCLTHLQRLDKERTTDQERADAADVSTQKADVFEEDEDAEAFEENHNAEELNEGGEEMANEIQKAGSEEQEEEQEEEED